MDNADFASHSGMDADKDGVPSDLDCNDLDANVGELLFDSEPDQPGDLFAPEPLGDDWAFDGGTVYATAGGQ